MLGLRNPPVRIPKDRSFCDRDLGVGSLQKEMAETNLVSDWRYGGKETGG